MPLRRLRDGTLNPETLGSSRCAGPGGCGGQVSARFPAGSSEAAGLQAWRRQEGGTEIWLEETVLGSDLDRGDANRPDPGRGTSQVGRTQQVGTS
jgi:hypothetical protein